MFKTLFLLCNYYSWERPYFLDFERTPPHVYYWIKWNCDKVVFETDGVKGPWTTKHSGSVPFGLWWVIWKPRCPTWHLRVLSLVLFFEVVGDMYRFVSCCRYLLMLWLLFFPRGWFYDVFPSSRLCHNFFFFYNHVCDVLFSSMTNTYPFPLTFFFFHLLIRTDMIYTHLSSAQRCCGKSI